jgi:hypothetical protein
MVYIENNLNVEAIMARTVDKEKFLSKIPEQFRSLLRAEESYSFVVGTWKLDDDHLRTIFPSVPDKLKPLYDWRINKPSAKRGNRSNLPYGADEIKLAADLMRCSPGATIAVEDGVTGTLLTVQVLAKLDVDGQTKTVSITGIERVESKK